MSPVKSSEILDAKSELELAARKRAKPLLEIFVGLDHSIGKRGLSCGCRGRLLDQCREKKTIKILDTNLIVRPGLGYGQERSPSQIF